MVSIIIPHYNRAELLAGTLDSVRAQTCPDWEVIVVDDQSVPEQWEAIQTYADEDRIRILQRTDEPKGPSHCRNIGLEHARGEFVIFLDSDDLLAPGCVEGRLRAYGRGSVWAYGRMGVEGECDDGRTGNADTDARMGVRAYGRMGVQGECDDGRTGNADTAAEPHDADTPTRNHADTARADLPDLAIFPVLLFREDPGDSDILWNVLDGDDDLIRFLRSDPPWCVTSPIWRCEALKRIGGFNERVFYGDDADLHTRAILNGLRYEKHADTQPDCFIRRSETPRITSGMRPETVASRRTRLAEMQKLIDNADMSEQARLTWQGEYVAEAEFLLFNHPEPHRFVRDIVSDMRQRAGMSAWQRTAVCAYFAIALATRDRAYILLRLARKALKLLVARVWLTRQNSFCRVHYTRRSPAARCGPERA